MDDGRIYYTIDTDGSLLVYLRRCNRFNDHKKLEMDGDIYIGKLPLTAFQDIDHACRLIDAINYKQ